MCWEYLEANKCYYNEPIKEDKREEYVERVEEKRREENRREAMRREAMRREAMRREAMRRMHTRPLGEPDANRPTGRPRR